MPATRVVFESGHALPAAVVADSSFVFQALIDPLDGDGRHEACREFASRLLNAGTILITSSLIYLEAPQCWRRLYRSGALTASRSAADERMTRELAFTEMSALLARFLRTFQAYEVPISERLLNEATRMAGYYDLNAHDSLVAATTRIVNVPNLVALDRDFRRVDEITIWHP